MFVVTGAGEAELKGVGRDYPLSIEKLCPVLSYYVVADWREGCERCKQILRYGGMGHTAGTFSEPEYLRHLLGGLEVTAGAVADATCGNPPRNRPPRRSRASPCC